MYIILCESSCNNLNSVVSTYISTTPNTSITDLENDNFHPHDTTPNGIDPVDTFTRNAIIQLIGMC